jgi:hypothetical protein
LECTLDKDGIHIVLNNQQLVHFYFVNCPADHWEALAKGLKSIYQAHPEILEILYYGDNIECCGHVYIIHF